MSCRNKMVGIAAALAVVVGSNGVPALAEMSHEGHEMHQGHEASNAAPAAAEPGVIVREAKVQGYAFTYRLYSWAERNVMMKGMEGMKMAGMDETGKATNHLMLWIKGPDGKDLGGAKVGYQLTGPDKAEQKTMTMAMGGGYGADVILKAKGAHAVKAKAVAGSLTLVDEFSLTVK